MTSTDRGMLYIIFLLIFLLFTFISLYDKGIMLSIFAIISLNIAYIIWFLKKKYTQTYIVYIYFIYNILTLKLPIIWMMYKYSQSDILTYFRYRNIDIEDVLYASIYIFIFDILLTFYLSLFLVKKEHSKPTFNKLVIFKFNKFFVVFFLLIVSYLSKLYLVSTGVWFFYLMNDIDTTKIPFYTIATLLEKLDLFILLYFVYKFKVSTLTKKEIIVGILIFSISMFFAVISTSKLKIVILFLPIILMIIYMKKKIIPILIIIVLVPLFSTFFNVMTYLRHNPTKSMSEAIINMVKEESRFNPVYNDKLISRLDYQTVMANVLKTYPAFPKEFKFDYLNNIIGLVPRFLWNDKPMIAMDMNRIGYEIGYVHYKDKETAIGITPLGIAYYELGLFGILFITLFTAFLLAFFSNRLDTNYWLGFILSIMIAITLARNGTYVNIIPDLILTIITFFVAGLLVASEPKNDSKTVGAEG